MKTNRNQTGRCCPISFRRPPGSVLLQLVKLLYLLLPGTVCLVSGCHGPVAADDPGQEPQITVTQDSSRFSVIFHKESAIADTACTVRRLDLFIYDADGVKRLLTTRRWRFLPDSAVFTAPVQGIIAVAVANSTLDFNTAALQRYDSIEQLSYNYSDDSPSAPLMSGQCNVEAGEDARLVLSPLMTRVKTGEIVNELKGYLLLENPRIYLEHMNRAAEVLRTKGFRAAETVKSPPKTSLPWDIGIFPDRPGKELFCYPNDSPHTIGNPATAFVLECEIRDSTCRFRVPLDSLRRNSTVAVDIRISTPTTFESKVY